MNMSLVSAQLESSHQNSFMMYEKWVFMYSLFEIGDLNFLEGMKNGVGGGGRGESSISSLYIKVSLFSVLTDPLT